MNTLAAASTIHTEGSTVVPYRTDYPFQILSWMARGNPVAIGVIYFLIEFGGSYSIGLLTGQLHGKNGLAPMYSRVLDNAMMGFLAPVGAALLCHMYYNISTTFETLLSENLIASNDRQKYVDFLGRLDKIYNSVPIALAALVISVAINLYNYFLKTDSWLGINGGITGVYGRVFVGLNYYILTFVVYKSAVTIWALRKTLQFDVHIRPFHPDRSGGLKMMGRLAIALNYVVTLLLVYFTLLFLFDEFARQNPVYVGVFILFYPFAIISFFATLSGAHKKMALKKAEVLDRLGNTFDHYYKKLASGPDRTIYDITSADEIAKIHSLYQIAEKMPVWPFDKESLTRVLSALTFPVAIFAINLLANADSIIYNLDKLKNLFD